MGKLINLEGRVFGRLSVISRAGSSPQKKAIWRCRCTCGRVVDVLSQSMLLGRQVSCGCYSAEIATERMITHGGKKKGGDARLYEIWCGIKKRCNNENSDGFKNYGGRGVCVCADWQKSFIAFRDWALSHSYTSEMTIERINVNGDYEPNNCCWIPKALQPANTRTRRAVRRSDGALFPSITIAERATGSGHRYIHNALTGKCHTAKGYGWRYATHEEQELADILASIDE
jgi:hypothetical protein